MLVTVVDLLPYNYVGIVGCETMFVYAGLRELAAAPSVRRLAYRIII